MLDKFDDSTYKSAYSQVIQNVFPCHLSNENIGDSIVQNTVSNCTIGIELRNAEGKISKIFILTGDSVSFSVFKDKSSNNNVELIVIRGDASDITDLKNFISKYDRYSVAKVIIDDYRYASMVSVSIFIDLFTNEDDNIEADSDYGVFLSNTTPNTEMNIAKAVYEAILFADLNFYKNRNRIYYTEFEAGPLSMMDNDTKCKIKEINIDSITVNFIVDDVLIPVESADISLYKFVNDKDSTYDYFSEGIAVKYSKKNKKVINKLAKIVLDPKVEYHIDLMSYNPLLDIIQVVISTKPVSDFDNSDKHNKPKKDDIVDNKGKRKDYISWTEFFIGVAKMAAKRSKDPSTQVGCCIVKDNKILSVGYNGFPNGCSDDEFPWNSKPIDNPIDVKDYYVVHAELNAILNSGNVRELKGATLYTTLYPCNECAKAIIQCGIKNVCYIEKRESNATLATERMFMNCGIRTEQIKK